MLVLALQKAFPDHKFLGEESVSAGEKSVLTDAATWVIDPIDGTTNFVHGYLSQPKRYILCSPSLPSYPFICICIGLVINKQPQVGVVLNPILGETFTAYKGGGAFLNGKRIHVSHADDITHASISSNIGI